MASKPAFVIVILSLLGTTLPVSGEGAIKPPPQASTTEHVDFPPGGLIHINGSYGELNVDGWDRPEIEVTVTKTLPYGYKSKQTDQARAHLDGVRIVTERKVPGKATISTELPLRHLPWTPPFTRHTAGGVTVQYEIHVPRDSHLAIHHGTGLVSVSGIDGDIDASVGRGDILLWLPPGSYSLDARTRFGIVSSDIEGSSRNQYLIGESFTTANPAPSHRLHLRMGFGGITLKETLPQSQARAAQ
jgi:hypothetical protein